jgi:hypothetical protein
MGLIASVMCGCFAEGRCGPFPLIEHVRVDEEGYLHLDHPHRDSPDNYRRFNEWISNACEHPRMRFASECISNWTGYRSFQQTLASVGWEHFPALKAELPENNGGLTEAAAAKPMLEELAFFSEQAQLGSTTLLVNTDTGEELHEYIAAYDGVFHIGADGIDMGVDEAGFFVCEREGRELFRSMKFRQNLLNKGFRKLLRRPAFEFIDLETERRFLCRNGVLQISNWPDGRLQDDKGRLHFEYPVRLHVTTRQKRPSEFEYILEPLRRMCEAAVETGNPIRWS